MKTKKRPEKRTVKKAAVRIIGKRSSAEYACEVCGSIVEADQCGCETPTDLLCCGKKMVLKR